MKYPRLSVASTSREMVDVFAGYNHNLKIGTGEFYETKNLTTKYYPMLANRPARGIYRSLSNGQGLIEKDALCWVDNGTLYVNGAATSITTLLVPGRKQLISMGAYIVIFPDKVYYNTEDPTDCGSLEASFTGSGSLLYQPCRADGTVYSISYINGSEPEEPSEGEYWIDTEESVLKQYSASMQGWTEIPTVYTKIRFNTMGQIPQLFKEYDGVTISGAKYEDLNGEKILYAVGGDSETPDYIVLVGLIEGEYEEASGSISIQRKVPDMDYVCECQNRIWGCYYGNDGTQNLNEIYCCALGDFKNWSQYLGLSTDSWRGSVGSDGQWTGAVNYLGSPVFFKENHLHQVTVSAEGAHRLDEMTCRGVQKGSDRSLQVINETLYFKSRTEVMAWQGGFPQGVGKALGDVLYYDAVAGVFGERYYLSMHDAAGSWALFTYDADRGIWMHEDELHAEAFARVDDELYCLAEGKIYALNGSGDSHEQTPEWMAETGILYYAYPDKKYVSRFNIRVKLEEGSEIDVLLDYDSQNRWERVGHLERPQYGTGTVTLPVRPRRCDHMRMRLTGRGDVRLFSIAKVLEVGSDV